MIKIVIGQNEAGQRVDRFLRKYFSSAPLSGIYRIIRKDLKVNGKRVREDTQLCENDELFLYLSQEQFDAWSRPTRKKPGFAKKQFQVIYEDDQVLIVSKPRGLLTHGDAKEKSNTLANQVCGYLQEKGEYDPSREKTFVPSPVNRLDRNTSGLVIFGKTAPAVRELTKAIRQRDGVRKFYLAVVSGAVRDRMVLTDRLAKDTEKNRVSITSGDDGLASETRVRPVKTGSRFSLVEAELITGRTHQIRAHLAKAGHPLIGDPKYGDPAVNQAAGRINIPGQLLHAYRLEFGELGLPLQELSGKRIEARPPKAFERAEKELIHE